MELKHTVALMNSDDYKERFKAEYHQLKIRCEKLADLMYRYAQNELDFELSCPADLLTAQLGAMNAYLLFLKQRAAIEGITI